MKQLDLQVIQQARAWVAQGHPVWLCTVLATFMAASGNRSSRSGIPHRVG